MAALDPKSLDPLVKRNAGSRYEEYQADLKKADENFEKAMANSEGSRSQSRNQRSD